MKGRALFPALALCFAVACLAAGPGIPEYTYEVVHVYPHDASAFTQGLEYHDGFLYEGTGLKGRSTLRKVQLETGRVLQEVSLDPRYFGEGITLVGPHIFELTWQAQTGFEYDRTTFRRLKTFEYAGEGWGLTNNGRYIYMSDGTPRIRVWDPSSLKEIRRFTVHDGSAPVFYLNELEWVRGEIFANVWQSDKIARISPATGAVTGWIDMAGILPEEHRSPNVDVLNGIAYDAAQDRLFVTGKLWPKLFQIKLVKR